MVVFGQKWLYSGKIGSIPETCSIWEKVVVFGQIGCVLANVVVFGQIGCIFANCCIGKGNCFWAKMVVFWQKWFYPGKKGCIRAKVVVFMKIGCIPTKWLFSGKVVVFG